MQIGVQAGKVSQDVLTNWPQPCKEDALQSYRSLKWVMYDDQLKIAEAQVAEEALKATSDLSSCDDLGKDDGEDKRDQKIQTQEADKGEDADDERPDVAVSAVDETVDGDTTMTAHHSL